MTGLARWTRTALAALVLATALLLPAASVAAAGTNPFGEACSVGAAAGSTVCQTPEGDPVTTQNGLIHKVTVIIAIIAGAAAIIVIAVGGIRYITSGGNPEQIAQAKRTIIFAMVGLIVITVGEGVISFVLGYF